MSDFLGFHLHFLQVERLEYRVKVEAVRLRMGSGRHKQDKGKAQDGSFYGELPQHLFLQGVIVFLP